MIMMRTISMINSMARPKTCDGFIAITVLWILGGLSMLVSIYAAYVINTASAFAGYDDRLKADALVSAALELTAYQQQAASTQSRPTHGTFAFRLGQANVAVEFRSEVARIDLNTAPKQVLLGLFITLGARPEDAENYAARVIGWRTPQSVGQDAEAAGYRLARVGYQPRGAKFPHVNELSLVRDLPLSLVERALPFVTVYSGRPQINIVDAAPEVIAALPGMSVERVNEFLVIRQTSPERAKQLLPPEAQQFATLEGNNAYRVTVRISFDNGHAESAEVVVLLFQEGDQPFAILSWLDAQNQMTAETRL
jgi:general secretion pathway protein K